MTMATRRDAVAAAAEAMLWLERRCGGASLTDVPEEALEDPSLVCTVGEVDIHPGTSNVIAKYANISVDIRRAARAAAVRLLRALHMRRRGGQTVIENKCSYCNCM